MNVHLYFVGSYTFDLLEAQLRSVLRTYGVQAETVNCGFGSDLALLQGTLELPARTGTSVVVVMPNEELLFERFYREPVSLGDAQMAGAETAKRLLNGMKMAATTLPEASWVVVGADVPAWSARDACAIGTDDPLCQAISSYHHQLLAEIPQRAGWTFFDRARISHAYGSLSVYDPRLWYLARYPASADGTSRLAEYLASHLACILGRMKKVLVVDCDNTLWGGIVGEDGVYGIQIGFEGIGAAYRAFQASLLAIQRRGGLLAISSRNNPEDVAEVFAKRDEMVLKEEHFCASVINWGRKSDGIRQISEMLGLGLDSFVFIDDNPAEREEIKATLPEVTVPDFPLDPAYLPRFGYELGWKYFYRIKVTDEDQARTKQYQSRAAVIHARQVADNEEEFLANLQMQLLIEINSPDRISRSAQLSQKTNQFNLTLRRYTESELATMMDSDDHIVISCKLEDRFADHGWVGLCVLRRWDAHTAWFMDAFLMSCRVLGRNVEKVFLQKCTEIAKRVDRLPILAQYVPGPKNQQVIHFLEQVGFELLHHDSGGVKTYRLGPDANCTVGHIPVVVTERGQYGQEHH